MIVTKRYNIKKDKAGKDVITKPSLLAHYGISLPQFNVKDMRFDKKTTGLIEARKDAQKAKQDAITAKAKGDAKVATAKATQEVLKQSAVTIAEKDRDVAKLKAEQEKVAEVIDAEKRKEVKALDALAALEEAKAMKTRANAKRQELVLAKGLSKYDEYRIKMECDRDVNVAKAMATWVGPVVAVNGGGSEGGSGLGDVLMLERYMEIAKKNGSQPVK